jgi:hypothetical protein
VSSSAGDGAVAGAAATCCVYELTAAPTRGSIERLAEELPRENDGRPLEKVIRKRDDDDDDDAGSAAGALIFWARARVRGGFAEVSPPNPWSMG